MCVLMTCVLFMCVNIGINVLPHRVRGCSLALVIASYCGTGALGFLQCMAHECLGVSVLCLPFLCMHAVVTDAHATGCVSRWILRI